MEHPDVGVLLPRVQQSFVAHYDVRCRLQLLDVRASSAYREARISGVPWSIRPRLTPLPPGSHAWVLVADDPRVAALAAMELGTAAPVYLLEGGFAAWAAAESFGIE